jgi:hypothetical protein
VWAGRTWFRAGWSANETKAVHPAIFRTVEVTMNIQAHPSSDT